MERCNEALEKVILEFVNRKGLTGYFATMYQEQQYFVNTDSGKVYYAG